MPERPRSSTAAHRDQPAPSEDAYEDADDWKDLVGHVEVLCRYCEDHESLVPSKMKRHAGGWCPESPDKPLDEVAEDVEEWFEEAHDVDGDLSEDVLELGDDHTQAPPSEANVVDPVEVPDEDEELAGQDVDEIRDDDVGTEEVVEDLDEPPLWEGEDPDGEDDVDEHLADDEHVDPDDLPELPDHAREALSPIQQTVVQAMLYLDPTGEPVTTQDLRNILAHCWPEANGDLVRDRASTACYKAHVNTDLVQDEGHGEWSINTDALDEPAPNEASPSSGTSTPTDDVDDAQDEDERTPKEALEEAVGLWEDRDLEEILDEDGQIPETLLDALLEHEGASGLFESHLESKTREIEALEDEVERLEAELAEAQATDASEGGIVLYLDEEEAKQTEMALREMAAGMNKTPSSQRTVLKLWHRLDEKREEASHA